MHSRELMALQAQSIVRQSDGRAGEKYLPVDGLVRKLRAVETMPAPSLLKNECMGKVGA